MKSLIILLALFGGLIAYALASESRDWKLIQTNDDASHRFVLALKPSDNVQKLESYVIQHLSNIESVNYGKYFTVAELRDYLASKVEYRTPNIQKLAQYGILCQDMSDTLICYSRVSKIDRVFGTSLQTFQHKSGKIVRTSVVPYRIPTFLKGIVFAEGLSNPLPHMVEPKKSDRANVAIDPGYISREVLMRIYNLDSTFVNHSSSVGAIAFMDANNSDGFDNHTMLESQNANGIQLNPITPDRLIGKDSIIPDGESDLDTQVMYWAASDADLWYETSDAWMYMWAVDFANREKVPEVASISWGWSEAEQCTMFKCNGTDSQTYVQMTNAQFLKIVARGITIVTASGDAGSPGRTNELCYSKNTTVGWDHINPIFPGSSPWVLSVGATYVLSSNQTFQYHTPICTSLTNVGCANGTIEQAATYDMTHWTSGAAFSLWDQTPSWQAQQVKDYLSSGIGLPDSKYFNSNGRSYPDISAFGHNCVMRSVLFGWQGMDGTSCAAPVMAGGIAYLNAFQKSRGKPNLGFVNPLLYKIGQEMPDAFNDVTIGNSACTEQMCCGPQYGFKATKGWDVVSGWGTPNFGQIKKFLLKY